MHGGGTESLSAVYRSIVEGRRDPWETSAGLTSVRLRKLATGSWETVLNPQAFSPDSREATSSARETAVRRMIGNIGEADRKDTEVKNMRILVLGGAGYIGSHTVYALAEAGHSVAVIDNLETGHRAAVHPSATFYQGDLRDRNFVDSVLEQETELDAVIHFAANSLVAESMRDPLKYYDNNLCGTKTMLESMVAHGVDKIVFSSTAATYGIPERVPIRESDRTEPVNPYGETKLSMEKMFKWVGKAHGLRFVSLRYFNAAGAHVSGLIGEDHHPETHLIPLILQVPAGKREFISIFGTDYATEDGTCVRDYIHVTDLAQAHIKAVEYLMEGGHSEIFNLGNGVGFSVRQVIDTARKVTGLPIPEKEEARRPGDPDVLIASSDKARELLGWKPEHDSLEDIIATAWNWHRRNPDGYRE